MSQGQSTAGNGQTPLTPADASRLQSHGDKHPDSATARTGFVQRAQRAVAAKGGASSKRK